MISARVTWFNTFYVYYADVQIFQETASHLPRVMQFIHIWAI